MKTNDFQGLVDHALSGLVWDEQRQQTVLHAIRKEEKTMKKMSKALILSFAILCLCVSALAAGITFSPQYDAVKIAKQKIEAQYGVTEDLLSLFCRTVETDQGITTITYSAIRVDFPFDRMGDYTAVVEGNKAVLTWTNDGKSTTGGLTAEAYGPEQLKMLAYDYEASMEQLRAAGMNTGYLSAKSTPAPTLQDRTWTAEDQQAADQALMAAEKANEERKAFIRALEALGKITVQEAAEWAKSAIAQEYGLSNDQMKMLIFEPDSTYASFDNDQPVAHLLFWLWQGKEGFTEKDGQYWVAINLNTCVIEDILYDPGTAGNG